MIKLNQSVKHYLPCLIGKKRGKDKPTRNCQVFIPLLNMIFFFHPLLIVLRKYHSLTWNPLFFPYNSWNICWTNSQIWAPENLGTHPKNQRNLTLNFPLFLQNSGYRVLLIQVLTRLTRWFILRPKHWAAKYNNNCHEYQVLTVAKRNKKFYLR